MKYRAMFENPSRWSGFADRDDKQVAILYTVALAACCLLGGSSRSDVASLVILRIIIAIGLACLFFKPSPIRIAARASPMRMLIGFNIVILAGLIMLPGSLWLLLPGHAQYAQVIESNPDKWYFLSLTPDGTINAALALWPAFLALICGLSIGAKSGRYVVNALLVAGTFSALLGVAQVIGGDKSSLYSIETSHVGFGTGFFTNRNHHAAFLSTIVVFIGSWIVRPGSLVNASKFRISVGLVWISLIVVALVATGSRTGLVLIIVGLIGSTLPLWRGVKASIRLVWAGFILGVLGLVGAVVILSGRAFSVERLFTTSIEQDLRILNAPTVIDIIGKTMPFGTGGGSFDKVFRGYEPDSVLRFTYFNHAHNDLLELAFTHGALGIGILLVFLVWLVSSAFRLFRPSAMAEHSGDPGRAAFVGIAILLAASLTDYPLRTPLLSFVFATLCALVEVSKRGRCAGVATSSNAL